MKIIAIIPARDNSKRIKNKNLLKINKKPVLKINFTNLQDCWRSHKESTISEPSEEIMPIDPKINQAALTIQVAVRRWLTRRKRNELAKSQPFLNKPITYFLNALIILSSVFNF